MRKVKEPAVEDFFASSAGVCIYVTVDGQTHRVEFPSADSEGSAKEPTLSGAEDARRAAKSALDQFRLELSPLFARVAAELASRGGERQPSR